MSIASRSSGSETVRSTETPGGPGPLSDGVANTKPISPWESLRGEAAK